LQHSFVASGESGRSVTCIAASGLSVWISLHNSAIVRLFHATTYEWLAEVNVAPAVTKMLASKFKCFTPSSTLIKFISRRQEDLRIGPYIESVYISFQVKKKKNQHVRYAV
jgi:hypothetical protein